MRTKRSGPHALNPNKFVVVKHNNLVVLCPDEVKVTAASGTSDAKDTSRQPCLIVLYKVNDSKESAPIGESTSSDFPSSYRDH